MAYVPPAFRTLLRDVADHCGGYIAFFAGIPNPVRGRFAIDPILVPGSPAESGLRSTEIWFYFDSYNDWPIGAPAARQGDQVVIDNVLYSVVDVLRDDLGENGLQLHQANPRVTVWDPAQTPPTDWDNNVTRWY